MYQKGGPCGPKVLLGLGLPDRSVIVLFYCRKTLRFAVRQFNAFDRRRSERIEEIITNIEAHRIQMQSGAGKKSKARDTDHEVAKKLVGLGRLIY